MQLRTTIEFEIVAVIAATLLILFLRRPDQFLHPYIWVEDGYYNLKTYAQDGAYVLIEPLSGYHLFASKLLSYVAFSISVPWTPEIEIALITAFTCIVTLAISLSPTHLPLPFFCAIGALLVPTAPEVFAVAPYAGWWAGLLLCLVPLWRSPEKKLWRWLYVVLGGMSSPLIVPITGIQFVRTAIDRNRVELITTGLCALVAVVQVLTIWHTSGLSGISQRKPFEVLGDAIEFAGAFFVGDQPWTGHSYYLPIGSAAILAVGVIVWMIRRDLDHYFYLLLAMTVAACAASTVRFRLEEIHPYLAGPRYFFYPFVLLTWIGVWVASKSATWIRCVLAASYLTALALAWSGMYWRHDPIDWRGHLDLCSKLQSLELPILWAPHALIYWREFSGKECKAFIDESVFPIPQTGR
jgi:hypothetical protein